MFIWRNLYWLSFYILTGIRLYQAIEKNLVVTFFPLKEKKQKFKDNPMAPPVCPPTPPLGGTCYGLLLAG
jgi:hypothetical protein